MQTLSTHVNNNIDSLFPSGSGGLNPTSVSRKINQVISDHVTIVEQIKQFDLTWYNVCKKFTVPFKTTNIDYFCSNLNARHTSSTLAIYHISCIKKDNHWKIKYNI